MTLATIIETLKMIALKHPNVNSAYEGNIYEILNANPNNKYASVVITQQSHTTDEVYDHYGFVIFYVDRLVDDMEDNRVQIQSCGKSMLGNIITFFCEEFEAECDNITYQPFTQKFVDMTCGVYCTITIDTVKDIICPEEYWKEDWVTPVTVIRNQDKRVTFTENGTYTIDYDPTTYTGLGNVEVNVNIDVDSYYNNGYNQGKTDGVNEQKSKLESINITENGTYTKQDGYNHIEVNVPDLNGSYDEGYQQGHTEGYNEGYTEGEGIGYNQGQADIASKARVLEVAENGQYLSKFSDPILPTVTGVYADDTEFYSYAELNGAVYDTKILATKDSRIELWWKNDGSYIRLGGIIGSQQKNIFKFVEYSATEYRIEYGNPFSGSLFEYNFTYDMASKWNHIIFSKQDGLNVNGELICEIQGEEWIENAASSNFWINASYLGEINSNANGCFGMIKIDNTIIIPTADGFLNTNTGELLEVVQDGDYTYTENLPIYGEGELYKTINVNVIPKINLQKTGLRLGYSSFTEVPEWADFDGITDMARMFSDCRNLQTIPPLNTSNVTNMNNMFYYCSDLKTIPQLDTSSVTNMDSMFYNCFNLQTIPLLDTSNVINMVSMFDGCRNLTSLPALNAQSLNIYSFLGIFGYNELSKLTDFGGFLNLKLSLTNDSNLKRLPNLTYESCINVLNGLYDFTGNGETPGSNQGQLKVHANFLTTVGDEISIGTNKGWQITA